MRYGWNPAKHVSNIAKHGVSFHDAEGYGEVRLVAYGAIGDRLHAMVYVIRRPVIWVISLRKASNKEIRRYASDD